MTIRVDCWGGGDSIRAESLGLDRRLRSIGESLRRAVGSSVGLWVQYPSTNCWTPHPDGTADSCFSLDGDEVDALVEAVSEDAGTPLVRSARDGSFLVALPVQLAEGPVAVAVARLKMTAAEVLETLARSLQREIHQHQELAAREAELQEHTEQISQDLEEIQFLLTLTEHMELCDLQRPVGEIAEAILPVLRELIRARAVVAIPAGNGPAGNAGAASPPAAELCWFGPKVLSDHLARRLVARFQGSARGRPVVKNNLSDNPEFAEFPGLSGFLLVEADAADSYGWSLLALNRASATGLAGERIGHPGYVPSSFEFGTAEARMMTAAAVMLATHGRNLHFINERESLQIGALRALINAVDAKDSYTCGHSDRVALISKRLGEELGLDRHECEQLYVAGLLHDIGKIGIPDRVLRKPGSLTRTEFAQIQRHAERGHAILKHLTHLHHALPAVLHHHERWDGQGYPRGLAGDAIPLAARIIAVADSYDAMTSFRPYRKAMPEQRAEAILRNGSGTQWDVEVVQAFFRILPEIRSICQAAHRHTRNILGQEQSTGQTGGQPAEDFLAGAVKGIQLK
jgi:HD-GYP domain-containing protein (c-di-GMP phosphodiesterase class II)